MVRTNALALQDAPPPFVEPPRAALPSLAELDTFHRDRQRIEGDARVMEALRSAAASALRPIAGGLGPIVWSRLTLGVDGLSVDHTRSERDRPANADILALFSGGAAAGPLRDPIAIEHCRITLLRARLRYDFAAQERFRRRVARAIEPLGVGWPEAVWRLLTVARRFAESPAPRRLSAGPAGEVEGEHLADFMQWAPGVFTYRLYGERGCRSLVEGLRRSRVWRPAQLLDYADVLGEERVPSRVRRDAQTSNGALARRRLADFKARVGRTAGPLVERAFQLPRLEPRECHLVRYVPGGYFGAHTDHGIKTSHRQFSLVCYLNDDFEGGLTAFPLLQTFVRPRAGHALVFPSEYLHASTPLKSGTKYILVGFLSADARIREHAPSAS